MNQPLITNNVKVPGMIIMAFVFKTPSRDQVALDKK